MKKQGKKFQFSNCLVNGEKHGSVPKSQFSISSMDMEKLKIRSRATFRNLNIQSLCELGKMWKYSLCPRIESPKFESIGELGKIIS